MKKIQDRMKSRTIFKNSKQYNSNDFKNMQLASFEQRKFSNILNKLVFPNK